MQKISIFVKADMSHSECLKYFTLRELMPHPTTSPIVVENKPHLRVGQRLSSDAIAFILESDTVWLVMAYAASEEAQLHPSHLGMNHRGGRPGFIRVKPSDDRTVVLPDFSSSSLLNYRTVRKLRIKPR